MRLGAVILAFSALVLAAEVRLLPETVAFQSDGSLVEGTGYVSLPLYAEHTGSETPLRDYSISSWMRNQVNPMMALYRISCESLCSYTNSAVLLTYNSVTYALDAEKQKAVVAISPVSTWAFVAVTHCSSQKLIQICYNSQCATTSLDPTAYLADGQRLDIGKEWGNFGRWIMLGDMILYTNKCMSPAEFASKQLTKGSLASCLLTSGGFYQTCGKFGLIIQPAFSGEGDLSLNPSAPIYSNLDTFQTTYAVSILAQNFYYGGWYKFSSFQALAAPLAVFTKKLNLEFIELKAAFTASAGPITLTLSWNFGLTQGVIGSVTAQCASLPSSGFVYVFFIVEESGGSSSFTLCCDSDSNCSSHSHAVTGLWPSFTADDYITVLNGYPAYYLKITPYTGASPAVTAALIAQLQAEPTLAAVATNCALGDGPQCKACLAGFYLYRNNCRPCHPYCMSCSGPGLSHCSICKSGYYSQPNHLSICLPSCPSGYTATGQVCMQTSSGFLLDVDLAAHSTFNFTVSNGQRIEIRSYTNHSAFFLPSRGLFLDYTAQLLTPNFYDDSPTILLSSDFSYDVWVLPQVNPILFCSHVNATSSLAFGSGRTDPSYLALQLTTYRQSPTTLLSSVSPLPLKIEWSHYAFTLSYDSITDQTTAYVVKNRQVSAALLFPSFYRGSAAAQNCIGMCSGGFGEFQGVVYAFRIANFARTISDLVADLGVCSGCSGCPVKTNSCLSLCKLHEYVAGDKTCQPCSEDCLEGCSGPTYCDACTDPLCSDCSSRSGLCAECYPGASLSGGHCVCENEYVLVNKECRKNCDEGYFVKEGVCRQCQIGCKQCENEDVCTLCRSEFLLIDGRCSCGQGWFIADSLECEQCDSTCYACERKATRCSACSTASGYFLSNHTCVDCRSVPGFDGGLGLSLSDLSLSNKPATLTNVCHETCGDGLLMGQNQCDDGNQQDGDGCSHLCTMENGWECAPSGLQASVCTDKTKPAPVLRYRNATEGGAVMVLGFNETVTDEEAMGDRVRVKVGYYDLFSVSVSRVTPPADLPLYSTFEVSLTFFQSIQSDTEVTITVPSDLTDLSGNPLAYRTARDSLPQDFLLSSTSYLLIAVGFYSGLLIALSALALLVITTISGRLERFWALLEAVQVVSVLLYVDLKLPDNLRLFLRGLSWANFVWLPSKLTSSDYDKAARPFAREKVGVAFLVNISTVIIIWLGIGALFVLTVALRRLFPKDKFLAKAQSAFVYSVIIRFAIESYLQTALSVFLQLREPRPSDALDPFNLAGTVLGVFLLVLLPLLLFSKVISKPSSKLKLAEYRQKFGSLYDCYKTSRKSKRSFLLVRLLRKMSLAGILVAVSGFGVAQTSLLTLLTIAYLSTVVLLWPFRERWLGNVASAAQAGLLLIAQVVMVILSLDNYGIRVRNALGWVAVALFIVHITTAAGLLVADTTLQVTQKLTAIYHDYAAEVVEKMKLKHEEKDVPPLETTVLPTEVDESHQQQPIHFPKPPEAGFKPGQRPVRRRVVIGSRKK